MQQGSANTHATRQPPHVLIVDDDADIRDVVGLLLQDDGFITSRSATLQQARFALENETVHLLITDRRLSGGDGFELIRFVRQLPAVTTRIILLTAARPAVSDDEQPFLEEADVRVIPKPFDIDQIVSEARQLTGWPGKSH